jgi:uncharacterized protein (TIGR02147 family)
MVAERKKSNRHFSFRYISNFLGLKSSGFFNLVLHGKRQLSESLALRVADLFKLPEREREYFLYLVRYGCTRKQMEKKFYFERMVACRSRHAKRIEPAQYLLYRAWYYHVIREMLPIVNFRGDYAALAKKLRPPISSREAREAVKVLQDTGLVTRSAGGAFRLTQPAITTGDEWESALIHNFQASLIEMSKGALESVPKPERDISSLTVSISQKTFIKMSYEIKKLRQKFLAMAEDDANADKVFICAIQLFPVTGGCKEE